jgi:hypothetical protein
MRPGTLATSRWDFDLFAVDSFVIFVQFELLFVIKALRTALERHKITIQEAAQLTTEKVKL